ncbi:acyltransferase family protein [Variovorax ginsengisoli]|uniref:Peptidoglycan/LPS O-acetylase OafA/YrhL n=1 Tax=Variovorax ginsengisoli TaxID=363844 RepID=A0ABT9SGK0_9BURK|nr:acyltransferase [Variovorax ginsengisoli]MDP9903034.1 peptidoglycan/LPS O-acetylase OafA/YrhL [Variovorax ginsengisoli]
MKFIHPLTSLRAFLAIWVLCRHWFYNYDGADGVFFKLSFSTPIFDKGYLGVDGFFILSGFILTYNYSRNGEVPSNYARFLLARIARIYPVHIICLLAAAGMILVKHFVMHRPAIGVDGNTGFAFLSNLVLMNSWFPGLSNGWNDVAWSVSAEWFAYLFFGVFLWIAPAKKHVKWLMLLPVLGLALVEWDGGRNQLSLPGSLWRLIPEFYLGVCLCRTRQMGGGQFLGKWGSLAAFALVVLTLFIGIDTLVVVSLALLIYSLSFSEDVATPAMSLPALIYLGEISYCIYMVQRIPQWIYSVARKSSSIIYLLPVPVQVAILLGMTILFAALLHHLIENPMRTRINRLGKKGGVGQSPVKSAVT